MRAPISSAASSGAAPRRRPRTEPPALVETGRMCHIRRMQNTRFATLDHDLGPEIDMLRTTVRDFADDKIAPIAAEIDRDDRFPIELWPQMGALGLHGITVEEELGGSGMGYLAHCVAMEEVSRGRAPG